MISELRIVDLGVIREARLDFKPGLNVLTGETGAGKTMVLTALGLLLGERSDSALVRAGASQTLVEGRWKTSNSAVLQRIDDAGAALDDGEILVTRTVSSDKSRALLGGVSVPAGTLAELGNHLVVVHGQSDQIRLKSVAAQREALDSYAGAAELSRDYALAYNEWRTSVATLERLLQGQASSEAEVESLKLEVKQFDEVAPKPEEDLRIAATISRLENSEALRIASAKAHEAITNESGETDVASLLEQAKRALEHEARNDAELEALAARISSAAIELRDVAAELSSYRAALEGDEEMSLEQAQSRKAQLNSLTRKHGPTLEEVFAWREAADRRLLELDTSDERVSALTDECAKQQQRAAALADELSALRASAATKLEIEVTSELQQLAMKDAELVVTVVPAEELGVHGRDNVSIQLRSYPGSEPRPLGKGASGGELSRIMLAIEVVLAKTAVTPTFVFDEVDAGIGGSAAIEVGKRLARLAKQAQVIVVTHLAQVAAFADQHLTVAKTQGGNVTESDVLALSPDQRASELARMLSGLADSDSAKQNALELMSLAEAAKTS